MTWKSSERTIEFIKKSCYENIDKSNRDEILINLIKSERMFVKNSLINDIKIKGKNNKISLKNLVTIY